MPEFMADLNQCGGCISEKGSLFADAAEQTSVERLPETVEDFVLSCKLIIQRTGVVLYSSQSVRLYDTQTGLVFGAISTEMLHGKPFSPVQGSLY